jgi:hypothetical protein
VLPPISPPALSWLRSYLNSDRHETKSSCPCFSVQLTSSRSARGLALRTYLVMHPTQTCLPLTGAMLYLTQCS